MKLMDQIPQYREISSRIWDPSPFLSGEKKYFLFPNMVIIWNMKIKLNYYITMFLKRLFSFSWGTFMQVYDCFI